MTDDRAAAAGLPAVVRPRVGDEVPDHLRDVLVPLRATRVAEAAGERGAAPSGVGLRYGAELSRLRFGAAGSPAGPAAFTSLKRARPG